MDDALSKQFNIAGIGRCMFLENIDQLCK